jgi:hypothetical protein
MAPSGRLGSRVALAALCAAWTAFAATPASGQAFPSLEADGRQRARAPKKAAAANPGAPLPTTPLLRPTQAAEPLGLSIPPEAAPLRGATAAGGDVPISANYGAPLKRAKLPRPYPPPRTPYPQPFSPRNALPALEPYKTSYVARQRLRLRPTTHPSEAAPPPPVTVAAEPTIKTKPKPKVELNPYDPLGVPVGSTLIFPFVQASGGYDDNPNRLAPNYNPRPSAFFRGEGGLKVQSNWARHSLIGDLRGAYTDYADYPAANRPEAAGSMEARYDVTQDTALDLRGRMSLDTQRPGAPAIQAGQPTVYVVNRPIILGVGTQAGVSQKFSRIGVDLRGTYDRVWYQDAQYSNGSTLNLAATSYNDYGGLLRTSYEVTPDLKPFVEATYDVRLHD